MFLIVDSVSKKKYDIITDILRMYTKCSPDPFPLCKKYSVLFLPAYDKKIRKPAIGQGDARTSEAQAVVCSVYRNVPNDYIIRNMSTIKSSLPS